MLTFNRSQIWQLIVLQGVLGGTSGALLYTPVLIWLQVASTVSHVDQKLNLRLERNGSLSVEGKHSLRGSSELRKLIILM